MVPLRDFKESQCELYRPQLSNGSGRHIIRQSSPCEVDEVKKAQWKTPQDIKDKYRSADFLSNNRVVFNIKGNDYRLIVAVAYRFQAVYIRSVGTHAEYDKIDADTVDM